MEKKPIVKLRVYRGSELNYDVNAKIKNENHVVSLIYGTKQWELFMKNLSLSGYCKVTVEQAFDDKGNSEYSPINNVNKFEDEVKSHFELDKPQTLTPDQVKIAELSAKLDELMKGNTNSSTGALPEGGDNIGPGNLDDATGDNFLNDDQKEDLSKLSLEKLQELYKTEIGKAPHHMAKEPKLIEAINTARASKS